MDKDYYAVLEVPLMADEITIRASYRRLAKLRHPDKNPKDPKATAQFQILSAAYETLIDSQKRREYDRSIGHRPCSYEKPSSANATYTGSQGAQPRSASYGNDEASRREWKNLEAMGRELVILQNNRRTLQSSLFETEHSLAKALAALDRLQAEDDKDAQDEAARITWMAYFFRSREPEHVKEARMRRATGRRTGRIVREAERDRYTKKIDMLESTLRQLDSQISSKKHAMILAEQREMRRQETLQREQRQAEHRQQQEAAQRTRQKASEDAQKRREEQARAEQARAEQARAEQARAEQARADQARREQAAQEAKKREQRANAEKRWNMAQEGLGQGLKARPTGEPNQPRHRTAGGLNTQVCTHRGWWARVEGAHRCQRCASTTARFAFKCPCCLMVACADCRNALKYAS